MLKKLSPEQIDEITSRISSMFPQKQGPVNPEDTSQYGPNMQAASKNALASWLKFLTPQQPEPGSDIGGYLGLIPGLAAMPGAAPGVQQMYRELQRWKASHPGMKGLESLPSGLQKQLDEIVRGVMFHGTDQANSILSSGRFSGDYVGSQMGSRFGEPHGISISTDPRAAGGFGSDIIRTTTSISPRDVMPVFTKRGEEAIIDSYIEAMKKTLAKPQDIVREGSSLEDMLRERLVPFGDKELPLIEYLNTLRGAYGDYYGNTQDFWKNIVGMLDTRVTSKFNKNISNILRQKHETEALLYNPNRFDEYEMRVLDPKKAIPLEIRNTLPPRYSEPKRLSNEQVSIDLRNLPRSMDEYYRKISAQQLKLGEGKSEADKIGNWIAMAQNPKTGEFEPVPPPSGETVQGIENKFWQYIKDHHPAWANKPMADLPHNVWWDAYMAATKKKPF